MIIQAIEFIRPYGNKEIRTATISDKYQENYDLMERMGCRLTLENLCDGGLRKIHICIEHPDIGDFDAKLVNNGPRVIEVVETMIGNFSEDKFLKWKELNGQG